MLPFLATCLFAPPPLRLTIEGLFVNISTSTFVTFRVGVVGLDRPFREGGGGAVKEDDSGLLCNGTVVPCALPFDRGFGDGEEALGLELPFVLAAFDVVEADDGGGRRGDLGGEGWTLNTG